MEPLFIDLKLDKFQLCICPDCAGDAVKEIQVELKDGTVYFLASCDRKGHLLNVEEAAQELHNGLKPRALHVAHQIDIQSLFIKPPEKEQKCKFVQWQKKTQTKIRPIPPALRGPSSGTQTVCNTWQWMYRFEWWMDADGKKVRLRRLPLAQLVSSILAIRKHNFARITKKIAWTKVLVLPTIQFVYPETLLDVGSIEASRKLEEFREEAEERGLL